MTIAAFHDDKTDLYRIVEEDGRVFAVDHAGHAIVGAYHKEGHAYWVLYLTTLVTDLIGRKLHGAFLGDHADAREWVELIAEFYVRAV